MACRMPQTMSSDAPNGLGRGGGVSDRSDSHHNQGPSDDPRLVEGPGESCQWKTCPMHAKPLSDAVTSVPKTVGVQTWYVSWHAQLPEPPKMVPSLLLVSMVFLSKCCIGWRIDSVSGLLCMRREMFPSAAGKPQQWLCNTHGLEQGPKVAEGVNVCKVGIRYHVAICLQSKDNAYNII